MEQAEFDKFAEEYAALLKKNIQISGEDPDFFSEYKIKDVAELVSERKLDEHLNILDFGCGIGNSIPFFRKHLPKSNLTCIDVSKKSLEICDQLHNGQANLKLFDGKQIPFSNGTFEVIFTSCVFHHIPHEQHTHLFKEIYRVLKPGGIFAIFEHNPLNPLTLHAVNTCPFDENAVLITARKLNRLLKNSGFNQTNIAYRIFFPKILQRLRPLEKFLTKLPIGAQYYIAAGKES